ncbi:J domain-containing protein [Haladaptatus salinisoli]|uniref:J domain-containing protein n=1 Tax=Haladaptatus salinisoli TaxID=2884876 RepID=UPI001D0AB56B|nr:J domain-containing protein [Haladaptatus salinisoli]
MHRSRLLLGIAAVFAGITVSMATLGFVYNPFLVVFAVPFGITAAILWYHATGRLAEKIEREAAYRDANGEFGPNPGAARERARRRTRQRTRRRADARARTQATVGGPSGPSTAEAYRILELSPDADADAVRRAYRKKVKSVHPDREDGNEEAFKRVNRAYERLQNDR